MEQENRNKIRRHAEFISASSTQVVLQDKQQRQAWKTLNQVQGDDLVCYNGKNAFTLIELLVVVLIIGILAAVAVPQYRVAVAKSRLATIRPLLSTIKQAEESYYMANGEYTTDWDVLGVDLSSCLQTRVDTDIRQCGNYFLLDPLLNSMPMIYAAYCPSYIQSTEMESRYASVCKEIGDFYYVVWLTNSERPDKIVCAGRTELGRQVCGSLNL